MLLSSLLLNMASIVLRRLPLCTCDRSVVFSGPPVSSTNKIDNHDITEILFESGGKHHQTNKQTNKPLHSGAGTS